MNTKNIEDLYPLSPMQEGMLFHSLQAPHSGVYVTQNTCVLHGRLDVEAFKKAWQKVVEAHPILRTGFIWEQVSKPLQVVYRKVTLSIEQHDWRGQSAAQQERQLEAYLREDRRLGYDLTAAPLMRLVLARVAENSYQFIWSSHHILMDGWSGVLLLQEIFALYEALRQGTQPSLQRSRPYRDYIGWLQQQTSAETERFWRAQLQGFTAQTPLGIDRNADLQRAHEEDFDEQQIHLSAELTAALQTLSRQQRLTLNTVVQGAWSLLLGKYSGEDDIVFGVNVSGRPASLEGVERMVGLFINTLPVRVKLPGEMRVLDWLKEFQMQQASLQQYEYSPLVQVQKWSDVPRGQSLFESIFVFENFPANPSTQKQDGNLQVEVKHHLSQTNYPLSIVAAPGQQLLLRAYYDRRRFDDRSITRLLGHLQVLLQSITDNPHLPLSLLQYLTPKERHLVVKQWNETQADYPRNICLHHLFETQAARSPDAVALVFEDQQMSYAELNRRANQLAHYLRTQGVGTESRVGLYMHRSLEMVISLLATLKAGAAYLPLDPSYPPDRISFMLDDAQVSLLLTQSHLRDSLPEHSAPVLQVDEEWESLISQHSEENPQVEVDEQNIAYVIYTSGSTGTPKGVMIPHSGICNRLLWMQEHYQLQADDCVLQKTPYSFDVSVWEFFWPLLTGARLVIAKPGGHQESAYLVELIKQEQVTTLHFVPSMLQVFVEEAGVEGCLSLRRVICSGEALPYALQERFYRRLSTAELHNLYGPTEASVDVTSWECEREGYEGIVPIGRPIANTQMYVLDEQMQPVPIGVSGELYIGGINLARGYLNRAGLTAERFVPDPLGGEAGARLYRTGDVGRYLEGGEIEYLGRVDHQVKVRGFRIELGEIEAVLGAHEAVSKCVAVVREDDAAHKQLVSYIVPDRQRALTVWRLLRLEKEGLPGRELYELPNGMAIAHLNKNETDFVYKEVFEDQAYLKHGVTLDDGACVFDVGANIGMFSLFVGRRCPNHVIYAFEPIPPVFESLRINADLYGINAKLFECGLAREAGSEVFTYYPNVSIISGRFADEEDDREVFKSYIRNQQTDESQSVSSSAEINEMLHARLTSQRVICRLQTVSEIIRQHEIERIDLLKVDVEKSELDVLAGILEEDWQKIRQVIVEVHDFDGRLDFVMSLLKRHGYSVVAEQDSLLKNTNLYNIYAVHPSKQMDTTRSHANLQAVDSEAEWNSLGQLTRELRGYLKERLPEYMIPSAFVMLEEMPLTSNGKIDRRALPAPHRSQAKAQREYVAPRNSTEETLVSIWADVLGVKQLGVHDNFFELGGDSIIAIQAVSKAAQAGVRLTTQQLFDNPTVAQLAASAGDGVDKDAAQGMVEGDVPLTPIQHRFFNRQLAAPQHFNQALLLRVNRPLEKSLLRSALHALLVHHDALRMRFVADSGGWRQFNAEACEVEDVPLTYIDISALAETERAAAIEREAEQAQVSLDLAHGPVMRVVLFECGAGQAARLLIVIHHLVVDGVSWRILLEDLERAYAHLSQGRKAQLPAKTTSFKQWSEQLAGHAQSEAAREELPYWLDPRRRAVARLPVDETDGDNRAATTETVAMTLSPAETSILLKRAPTLYQVNMHETLVAALTLALAQWTGDERVLLELEGHGREELMEGVNVSRTVGWFTTIYPVLLEVSGAGRDGLLPAGQLLQVVSEQLRAIPHRGIGYGLLRYLSLDEGMRRRLSEMPEAEVLFNYLGQIDQTLPAGGALELAAESSGPTQSASAAREHLIEVNSVIVAEQLRAEWKYSRRVHRRETIEQVAGKMLDVLRTVVRACAAQAEERGVLASSTPALARAAEADFDVRSLVLPIQPDGSRQPFFCVHPGGGQGSYYNMLAKALGDEQPFYAFQAKGLDGAHEPHTDLEKMARDYIRAMRAHQPQGPYLLGGWSFGAQVAFEMAQQLAAQGEKLTTLALLENGPDYPTFKTDDPRTLDDAEIIARIFSTNLSLPVEHLRQLAPDEQLRYVLQQGRAAGAPVTDAEIEEMRNFVNVYKAQALATHLYQPSVYAGSIALFRAAEELAKSPHNPSLGWERLVRGEIDIHVVPGDHFTMLMDATHVQALAQELRAEFDAVLTH